MSEPNFKLWYPVFGIRSYEEAIDYYVDWLGFNLDWEWRAAPGEPAIVSVSREGLTIGLNEAPGTSTHNWLCLDVDDAQALADEWNARRPGSVVVHGGVPYEGFVISLVDPFGNRIEVQQLLTDEQNEKVRAERVPKMRDFVAQKIADGKPVPSPDEVVAAIGESRGLAIEVLNEFPEYARAFEERRDRSEKDLEIEAVDLPAQPALVIERTAAIAGLPGAIGEVLPKVGAHLAGRDTAPQGLPFMQFLDVAQKFTVVIGFPSDGDVEGGGEIERRELPGGKAVTALYTGPPSGLPKAWMVLIAKADRLGRKRSGAWGGIGGWQVYLNDPAAVGAEKAQTRLYLPLAE